MATELDLTCWYLELVEDENSEEHQLFTQQCFVKQVIDWLIEDEGSIVVVLPPWNQRRPEDRVLKARRQ